MKKLSITILKVTDKVPPLAGLNPSGKEETKFIPPIPDSNALDILPSLRFNSIPINLTQVLSPDLPHLHFVHLHKL